MPTYGVPPPASSLQISFRRYRFPKQFQDIEYLHKIDYNRLR